MFTICYLFFALILGFLFLPIPAPAALYYLFIEACRTSVSRKSRLRLFAHLFAILSFFPVLILFGPIDLLLSLVYQSFRPSPPPIFICGTPRSGSTLLHRLIIQSSNKLYGITHFEWRYPSLTFQLLAKITGLKSYLSSKNYWRRSAVSDLVSKMHPNKMGDYEEDAILFEERVGYHPYQFLHLPLASLNWYFSLSPSDLVGGFFSVSAWLFRLYRMTLLFLYPLKHPALIFVSKEVASNEKLESLYQLFPGSRFIVLTRHPAQYLSSLKPLLEKSTISKTSSTDHLSDSSWWDSWYSWLCWQARTAASFYTSKWATGSHRLMHVRFETLVSEPRSQMSDIFSFLGLPTDECFHECLDRFELSQVNRSRGYDYVPVEVDLRDFSDYLRLFYNE